MLAGTDSHHVRIVVLAGQARGRVRPDEGGAHAFHAVGGHLLTVARATDNDAEAAGFADHSLGRLDTERRIVVERVVDVRAMVDDVMTGLAQVGDHLFLQLKTGVISGNMDAHGILLRGSRTSNAH